MSMATPEGRRELDHDEARAELSAYLDGRLAPDQLRLLEQHLGSCRVCAQEMAAVRATRQMLQALPEMRVPRPFTLEAPAARGTRPALFFWLRAATGLAAACFVLVVALPVLMPAALPQSQVAAPEAGQPQSKPGFAADSALRQGRDGQPTPPASAEAAGSAGEAKKQALPNTVAPALPRAAAPAAPAPAEAPASAPAGPAPMPSTQPAPANGAAAAAPQRAAEPALSADKPAAAAASQAPAPADAAFPTNAPTAAPLAAGSGTPETRPTSPAATYSAPSESGGASAGSSTSPDTPTVGTSPTAEAIAPREAESGWDPLAALRSLLGGVTLLLASATGAVWWRHRSR